MREHIEVLRENPKSDVLVLFVHGFMGSPQQFDPWMRACADKGYSVVSILLPGHGRDGLDFARNALPDWEGHVRDTLARFRARYRDIVAVGHSMGGLLLLNESLDPENRIAGLFMIAPPIKINLSPWSVKVRAELALTNRQKEIWKNYMRVYGIGKTPIYVYPGWLRQFAALKQLIEKAKRNLEHVSVPVFVVHSKSDETVSIKSSDSLDRGLTHAEHEHLTVDESWHAYYTQNDTRVITEKLLQFIDHVTAE